MSGMNGIELRTGIMEVDWISAGTFRLTVHYWYIIVTNLIGRIDIMDKNLLDHARFIIKAPLFGAFYRSRSCMPDSTVPLVREGTKEGVIVASTSNVAFPVKSLEK